MVTIDAALALSEEPSMTETVEAYVGPGSDVVR
jgi:hypothetical protein